ncbi:MAG: thioredoxin fold domain-containing protein [Candidatus Cloacimonetes bacterium]|nr:thioredoxin fold domain-containing protein [Candidatus Cloacimonadota bacterium]
MKRVLIFLIATMLIVSISYARNYNKAEPEHLDLKTFKEKVFDFEANTEWKFEGDRPCIIDFYADWCGPCKKIAPIMNELAVEYYRKVDIYKVDTDKQRELSQMFGIKSIPSVLFVPIDGEPKMFSGAYPKGSYVQMIEEILKVK